MAFGDLLEMKSISLRIVKRLLKSGELSLRDVAEMLPKKNKDHRDYYVLSNLIKAGFANMPIKSDEKPLAETDEMQLAILLYVWMERKGERFEYMGQTFTGGDFSKERIFPTAKADMFIDEIKAKRLERIWALAVGILIAVVSATLTSLFLFLSKK